MSDKVGEDILELIDDIKESLERARPYYVGQIMQQLEYQLSAEWLATRFNFTDVVGSEVHRVCKTLRGKIVEKSDKLTQASVEKYNRDLRETVDAVAHKVLKKHLHEFVDRVKEPLRALRLLLYVYIKEQEDAEDRVETD